MNSSEQHLRTNTLNEVHRGLEFVFDRLKGARTDPYQWKWVIIGLHNALQNAIIEAVSDSSYTNILEKGAKVYAAILDGTDRPEERLDSFPKLLKLAQSNDMLRFTQSRVLVLSDAQRKAIASLHDFRNEFIHFLPRQLSIELHGFEEMVSSVCAVIRFLLFESGNVTWYTTNHREVDVVLDRIQRTLSRLHGRQEKA